MNIFLGTLVCCLVTVSALSAKDQDWEFYKLKFNKNYNSVDEETYRREIFLKTRENVLHHNARYEAGLVGHSAGINQFSDQTLEEFDKYASCISKIGYSTSVNSVKTKIYDGSDVDFVSLPDNVDWREIGAVTGVKNQGQCGSCWAFSTTGTLEGSHFLQTGQLLSLSEQNLLDCDRTNETFGCNGGYMEYALKFVVKEKGIDTEESYPYLEKKETSHPVRKCHYRQEDSGASFKEVYKVADSMEALMAAVATKGPISVGVSVGFNWYQYSSGVLNDRSCRKKYGINHGVLLVGYGTTDDGMKYWLVKNSWGTSWGEKGYIRIRRGYGNDCGITHMAHYAQ